MKIAVLYPHNNILQSSGASLRVGLLAKYLTEKGADVTVFSVANEQNVQKDGIQYIFYWGSLRELIGPFKEIFTTHFYKAFTKRANLKYLRSRSLLLFYLIAQKIFGADMVQWFDWFCKPRFDHAFKSALESVISEADVVLLEYPFWANVVAPLCKQHGTPCVLTAYDILDTTYAKSGLARRRMLRSEVAALRAADYAFCVAEEDRQYFRRLGIETRCNINPIDAVHCNPETSNKALQNFRQHHNLPSERVCLFVGSKHPPNAEAAKIIEGIASKTPEITYVIVGTCVLPDRNLNIVKLGRISDEELRILYTLSDVVIVPLQRGTGCSIKLIEAIAYGKPIITTTIGCRGYSFETNVNGIICDDIEQYPIVIRSLLADVERRQKFSCQNKKLAQKYDYRNVFQPYWDIVQLHQRAIAKYK